MPKETKPTYYWDAESKSYKGIPEGKQRTTFHMGETYKNEAAIAAESPQFTYDELIDREWRDLNEELKATQIDPIFGSDAFRAGFTRGWKISGQLAGQTGFISGARVSIKQLTAPIDSGRFEYVDEGQNAPLDQPRTQLSSIRQDNLTAEICKILAAYAILPRDLKVRALLDAGASVLNVKFLMPEEGR